MNSNYNARKKSSETSQVPEYQSDSHPVPFGFTSILSALQFRESKAAETLLFIVINYLSNWKSNTSHRLSIAQLSQHIGISQGYVCKLLRRCSSWLSKLNSNRSGTVYSLTKHDTSSNLEGLEHRFLSIPYGFGSPIERMLKGIISWKACLVWIVLKVDSDWVSGITHPTNMLKLAKSCRLGSQTVCACISELSEVGLLKRISAQNEPAVYQLFPKQKPPKKRSSKPDELSCSNYTADHYYSDNWQYRIGLEDSIIEKRVGYREWKRATDYEVAQTIPEVIVNALREFAFHYLNVRSLKERLS